MQVLCLPLCIKKFDRSMCVCVYICVSSSSYAFTRIHPHHSIRFIRTHPHHNIYVKVDSGTDYNVTDNFITDNIVLQIIVYQIIV